MKFRFVIALCSLAAAGCAVQRTMPTATTTLPSAPATQGPAVSPSPADATTADAPVVAPSLPTELPSPAATSPATQTPATKPALAPQPSAAAPTGPDKPGALAAPDPPRASAGSQPSADTLDFASLGARLRATKAIGMLTKLSVKNQADELLEQFRDYYKRRSTATLPDLRRSYDMLVLKLLSLLQDGDPPLATDIDRSRTAIWDILSDQRKFVDSNLMAGASP